MELCNVDVVASIFFKSVTSKMGKFCGMITSDFFFSLFLCLFSELWISEKEGRICIVRGQLILSGHLNLNNQLNI